MNKLLRIMFASILLTTSVGANANLLSVELDNTSYGVGDTVVASVYFSDIEQDGLGQIPLAAYLFNLMFDDSLLAFDSINFGTSLDVGFFPSDQSSSLSGATLTIEEFSYGDDLDLAAMQTSSFLLASVSFTALQAGDELLSLSTGLFSDALGTPGVFDIIDVNGAIVSVTAPTSVPEPSVLSLLFCGLLLLAGRRSRR